MAEGDSPDEGSATSEIKVSSCRFMNITLWTKCTLSVTLLSSSSYS